jgi:hypothetical protein
LCSRDDDVKEEIVCFRPKVELTIQAGSGFRPWEPSTTPEQKKDIKKLASFAISRTVCKKITDKLAVPSCRSLAFQGAKFAARFVPPWTPLGFAVVVGAGALSYFTCSYIYQETFCLGLPGLAADYIEENLWTTESFGNPSNPQLGTVTATPPEPICNVIFSKVKSTRRMGFNSLVQADAAAIEVATTIMAGVFNSTELLAGMKNALGPNIVVTAAKMVNLTRVDPPSSSSHGLSGGAKAGIAIAVIATIIVLGAGAWLVLRRKKANPAPYQPAPVPSQALPSEPALTSTFNNLDMTTTTTSSSSDSGTSGGTSGGTSESSESSDTSTSVGSV